jgi:hypothetical protein
MVIKYLDDRIMKKTFSNPGPGIAIFLTAVFLFNCCCIIGLLFTLVFTPGWRVHPKEQRIGFSFKGRIPQVQSGDMAAGSHLFIHQYAIPQDGEITAVAYLNDTEPLQFEIPERVYILLLRPEVGGLRVVERIELPTDELTATDSGVIIYRLEKPLVVRKGDLFGHWQMVDLQTGPFPLNIEMGSVDGFSIGQAGFTEKDTEVGTLINTSGFTGRRDYFINLIFRATE